MSKQIDSQPDRCPFDDDRAFAIYIALIKTHKIPLSLGSCDYYDSYEVLAKKAIHAASVFEAAVDDSIQEILSKKMNKNEETHE